MVNAPYAEGVKPYLPLLPLISDRHVDALTLAGTNQEVAAHVSRLFEAGVNAIIVRPIAGDGVSVEDTIAAFSAIWPTITQA
jgi:5,10-methylenetetrahydromethanopterin reductase